jgi:hypothetical protein
MKANMREIDSLGDQGQQLIQAVSLAAEPACLASCKPELPLEGRVVVSVGQAAAGPPLGSLKQHAAVAPQQADAHLDGEMSRCLEKLGQALVAFAGAYA